MRLVVWIILAMAIVVFYGSLVYGGIYFLLPAVPVLAAGYVCWTGIMTERRMRRKQKTSHGDK